MSSTTTRQPAKIHVHLVDDDEDEFVILSSHLAKIPDQPFVLSWSDDYDASIALINRHEHDIYLIDYRLGFRSGLDLLREVDAKTRPEPFIVLTNLGDNTVELESIRLAASDYLIKRELTPSMLSKSLYYSLGRKEIEQNRIDELMRINNSKDEFISIASHQLRTPATAVKQYLGILQDGLVGSLNEKQLHMINKAYQSNERQLAIINDLLKVARIDSGHTRLNLEHIAIERLVDEVVSDVNSALQAKQQQLVIDIKPDAMIYGDDDMVRMALDNLLENASKYSDEHSQITIRLRRHLKSWHLSVTDEGVGVADTSKLFQKFSRIDNPVSTKVGGTGLGLYWSRTIARLHNGEITYEPNRPRGSIFSLILPIPDNKL